MVITACPLMEGSAGSPRICRLKMADCGDRATQARRRIHATVGSVCIWCDQLEKIAFTVFGIRTNGDDSSLFMRAAIGKMIRRGDWYFHTEQRSAKSNQEILRHLVRWITVLN
ncbi:hypothetical protein [Xanthomonas hortorum]|uniref:Uncharacterized protein n=1 Tax=Xanthomonas hortorum TaxID=56454 RepID=A0AA47EU92_9XANT|nr:hypothetical protein [Xanthomonas hortorum]WAH64260.1 hypothetical protein OEG85_23165 [Xanthomonas hortorum]